MTTADNFQPTICRCIHRKLTAGKPLAPEAALIEYRKDQGSLEGKKKVNKHLFLAQNRGAPCAMFAIGEGARRRRDNSNGRVEC